MMISIFDMVEMIKWEKMLLTSIFYIPAMFSMGFLSSVVQTWNCLVLVKGYSNGLVDTQTCRVRLMSKKKHIL